MLRGHSVMAVTQACNNINEFEDCTELSQFPLSFTGHFLYTLQYRIDIIL
jgi:hypothetical protein